MRVVAGRAKGRRLQAPKGANTRPTSDRVREAIFNALGSLDAVEGATVADLFAGSGAIGIEALSRGAVAATFVDVDHRASDAIKANLATTGFEGTLVLRDVESWVRSAPSFDVVFADPPYLFDGWPHLFEHVRAGLVVAESDRAIDPGPGWEVVRSKRYGSTVVTVVRLTSAS